ncbi:hypothetical protein KAF25_007810 [Fusarium avenaceum]|uniref:Heterokaryon incompatibility domain-containing protein n=1 Tax=Fusarium avenaceum TaxID=40199 RepID=A0A9P7H3M0_9HYPO|nr:hypothetical protein KAF25_007810 [Fusarium avenaceum]
MSAPELPADVDDLPHKFLSIQDGTLCDWCHDGLQRVSEDGEPFRMRALTDLLYASDYCHLCAMWVRALRQSVSDLEESGQNAALHQHPLAQNVMEPEDVKLQFLDLPDWDRLGFRRKIAWPRMGPIWATLDMIKADDANTIDTTPLPPSDLVDTTLGAIKQWLERCDQDHDQCKYAIDTAWKPTRLLHISPKLGSPNIRLVEGADIPDQVEYVTLSHRWGSASHIQLKKDNLESFKTSMALDNLSCTFNDACEIVRKLGHEYLWIDSLCIIQDDEKDWAFEAGRMASVYGNAWLSISAHVAAEDNNGLFSKKRDGNAWLPVWVRREWGGPFSGDYCVSEYQHWWMHVTNSSLNKRSWVLQERILAPRVLHLGLEQVALECCSTAVCERLPFGDPTSAEGFALMSPLKNFILGLRNNDLKDNLTVEYVFGNWNQIVRAYGQGQLTMEADKLVALAGLVDTFDQVFASEGPESEDGSEKTNKGKGAKSGLVSQDGEASSQRPTEVNFIAGLWRPYAEMQLVWRATSRVQRYQLNGNAPGAPGKRYNRYVAPSWSWCSLKDTFIEPQEARSIDTYFVKILDVKIIPSHKFDPENPLSGLKYCAAPGSFLRLQGSILPIAALGYGGGMQFINFNAPGRAGWEEDAIEVHSKNYWDVEFEQEALNCKTPFAVPVFADMTRITNPLHCLILDKRRDEQDKLYGVRVGACVIDEPGDVKAFWDGVEAFDRVAAGQDERHDGVYRLAKSGEDLYVKEDGVLQRVIEIR